MNPNILVKLAVGIAGIFAVLGCEHGLRKAWQADGGASLESTWKQGCFEVNGVLLEMDGGSADSSRLDKDVESPHPLHLKIALVPNGKCDDLKGGSADVVTGFGATTEEVDQRISLFDNSLRRNFWLIFPEGRVYPSLYHVERTYGLEDSRTFLLSFSLAKSQWNAIHAGSDLELAFEIPIKGAGVASLRWPAASALQIL